MNDLTDMTLSALLSVVVGSILACGLSTWGSYVFLIWQAGR